MGKLADWYLPVLAVGSGGLRQGRKRTGVPWSEQFRVQKLPSPNSPRIGDEEEEEEEEEVLVGSWRWVTRSARRLALCRGASAGRDARGLRLRGPPVHDGAGAGGGEGAGEERRDRGRVAGEELDVDAAHVSESARARTYSSLNRYTEAAASQFSNVGCIDAFVPILASVFRSVLDIV